jgi:lipopolysaccharide transport system ATP-binding protein
VLRFISIEIRDENGNRISAFHSGQRAKILFCFAPLRQQVKNVLFAVGIDNERGERVAYLANDIAESVFDSVAESVTGFEIEIDKLPLTPGTYRLTLFCSSNGEVADWIQNAASFTVEPGDFFGTGKLPPVASQGYCLTPHRFHLSEEPGSRPSMKK